MNESNSVTIELPASIHGRIQELARREGYSVSQFLASAAAEKLASILTVEYLRREAAKGSQEDLERVLAKIPATPIDELPESDRLPDGFDGKDLK